MKGIPYTVYKSRMSKQERRMRRLWVSIIVVLLMTFGTNAFWILRLFS